MFSFGEQLYRLTDRDEETLLVDPLFRQLPVALTNAQLFNFGLINVPIDRALYIESVSFTASAAGAGAFWTSFQCELDSLSSIPIFPTAQLGNPNNSGTPLVSDGNIAVVADAAFYASVKVGCVYPPGINRIRCSAWRSLAVLAATVFFHVNGYFLPPGRIGRR